MAYTLEQIYLNEKEKLILRTLKTGGLPEIKLLLASENEFSNFRAVC